MKLKEKCIPVFQIVLKFWSDITTNQGIEGTNYGKSKFIHVRTLFSLSNKYTKLSFGFN